MNGRVRILVGIIVLIIVLAIGAGTAWYFLHQPTVPSELQKATYVGVDASGKTVAFAYSNGAFTPVSLPNTTVSTAVAKNDYAVIEQNANSFSIQLKGRTILTATTTPANIAVSPDEHWIGFSLSKSFATTTFPVFGERSIGMIDPTWTATVVNTSNPSQILSLNLGSSPVFTDTNHVVWLSPRGLTGMDLRSGQETLLAPLATRDAKGPLLVSPDGKHVAFYTITKKTMNVYSVTPTTASLLSQISPDQNQGAISYALGVNMLYSVSATKTNTVILGTPFAGGTPKIIETIPNGYHITEIIIPNSL